MAKSIATILTLKDRMSPKIVKISKAVDGLSKKQKQAAQKSANYINKMGASFNKLTRRITQATLAIAALGITIGVKEAMNLQSYYTQLETATKSTERAKEVYKYAMNLANTTPYEPDELVKSAAALELAGLKAEDYLIALGNTAAGANRSIDDIQMQFLRAITTGTQLNRFLNTVYLSESGMKEFAKANGYSTRTIEEQRKTIVAYLNANYGGQMEALGKTAKGAWSNVTGITKTLLASMVGIDREGQLINGGLLQVMAKRLGEIDNRLQKLQESGKLGNVSKVLGTIFNIVTAILSVFFKFPVITVIILGLIMSLQAFIKVVAFAKSIQSAYNVVMALYNKQIAITTLSEAKLTLKKAGSITATIAQAAWTKIATAAQWAYNAALAASPIGWIIAGVLALIGVIVLLIKYWDKIKNGIGRMFGKKSTIEVKDNVDKNALGTNYFKGGRTLVGERGPELVTLPSGSRINTASKTKSLLGKAQNVINVYIEGAKKSDEEIADMVARKILEVLPNI